MTKKQDNIVMLQVPITEKLRHDLYAEVIARSGYLKRGILSEIVVDALKEYIDKSEFDRSRENKKNELARSGLANKKIFNSYNDTVSVLSILSPDVIKYSTKPIDGSSAIIPIGLLHKAIKKRFQVYDKRTIQRYVDILITGEVIGLPEADDRNNILYYTVILKRKMLEVVQ